jgi:hypothetical protein
MVRFPFPRTSGVRNPPKHAFSFWRSTTDRFKK